MGVERRWVRGRDLRDLVGGIECVGRGDYLHGSGECAGACDCDADGPVRHRWEQDCGCVNHGYGAAAGRCRGESDERVGADGIDAECHGYGDERPAE